MSEDLDWPPGACFDLDSSTEYYVIVGCGIAALANHLTLLVSDYGKSRLAERPILHIGLPDPWKNYYPVEMGQWPALLTLPASPFGYQGVADRIPLNSRTFVALSERLWRDLSARQPFFVLRGRVTSIREMSGRISLGVRGVDGKSTELNVRSVDICGGPGPAKLVDKDILQDSTLQQEYEMATGILHAWPRVVTGEAFLALGSANLPLPGNRIAVVGGGPTAAWCVERAEQNRNEVLWVHKDSLSPAFVSNGRNDGLAQGPVTRSRASGRWVVDGDLFPRNRSTKFAEGFRVAKISASPSGSVNVRFEPNIDARYVDATRTSLPMPSTDEVFQQVVIAFGQVKSYWEQLLECVLPRARWMGRHLVQDRVGRVIGMQSSEGTIRVLGAAALSHPDVSGMWETPGSASNLFFQTLVEQARVDIGMPLALLLIAEANQYWGGLGANDNLNTTTEADLIALLPGLSQEVISTWLQMRASRISPFTQSELRDVLMATKDCY